MARDRRGQRRMPVWPGALAALAMLTSAAPAHAGAGDIDKSFGDDGVAVLGDPQLDDKADAATRDEQERIVIVSHSGSNIEVDRLLPGGAPDPSFGDGGRTELDFGEPDQVANDVATDGSAVVTAGFTGFEGGDGDSYFRFQVNRLRPDGSLDRAFGDEGTAIAPFGSYATADGVAVEDDGAIVAAGSTSHRYGGPDDLAVARFTGSGKLDRSFADGGLWRKDLTPGAGKSDDSIEDVVVDDRGRILFAGATRPRGGAARMIVGRLKPNGELDRRYGRRGIRRVFVSDRRWSLGTALTLDRRDRVVLAGRVQPGVRKREVFGVARLTSRGRLGRSFSHDGRRTLGFDGEPADVATAPGNRIVIAGKGAPPRTTRFMVAARLERTGRLDRGFGKGGVRFVKLGKGPGRGVSVISERSRMLLVGDAWQRGSDDDAQLDIGVVALKQR